MHAVAVIFDWSHWSPRRCRVDQLRKLRRDPLWQRRRFAPLPARYGAGHGDGIERLPGRRFPTCRHCKGITFELAHAAKHVGEIDHLEEAHAPAG